MGRKRKKENEKLPPYVYVSKGRYVWRPYFNGKFQKEKRLCSIDVSLSEIWSNYESIVNKSIDSLRWLLKSYMDSQSFQDLVPKTRKDLNFQFQSICKQQLTDGREFGDVLLSEITPGRIRQYLDNRGKKAPVMANREVAFISMAWSWARERDIAGTNPCVGVRRNREKARTRYIKDEEYQAVYELALKISPSYIPPAMEIAFLCRARRSEVLMLKKDVHVLEEGLFLERSKKSKSSIIQWSSRLVDAVEAAKRLPGISWKKYLFHNARGNPINASSFSTAWQRLMVKAIKENVIMERFTFHDLKAKGVSDFDGDKKLASGHRSDAMVEIYDRKPSIVDATR